MSAPRQPSEATLGEFATYQELLTEAGKQLIDAEDTLIATEARQTAREARRRRGPGTPDAVGRGRA